MRRTFLEKITSRTSSPGSKIYLTHGYWWQDSLLNHLAKRRSEAVHCVAPRNRNSDLGHAKVGLAAEGRAILPNLGKYRHGPRSWTVGKSSKTSSSKLQRSTKDLRWNCLKFGA